MCAASRPPISESARLASRCASSDASAQATILRLNSTLSRTCQARTPASSRFQACTTPFTRPPERGLTVPMAATFPMAASRACITGIRSGRAISTPAAVCGLRARTRLRTSRKISISSALSTFSAPGCGHDGAQAPARRKFPYYRSHLGLRGFDDIAQHPVDHVFLEDAEIAIRVQIHLVGFELQAARGGHVAQHDLSKVRQGGLGANRSKLRHHDFDLVVFVLVGPGFNLWQGGVYAGLRMLVGIGAFHLGLGCLFNAEARRSGEEESESGVASGIGPR